MPDLPALGQMLRDRRLEKRCSLRCLADSLHISPTHLSDIERGNRHPSRFVLDELATALDLELHELLAAAIRGGAPLPEELRPMLGRPARLRSMLTVAAQEASS